MMVLPVLALRYFSTHVIYSKGAGHRAPLFHWRGRGCSPLSDRAVLVHTSPSRAVWLAMPAISSNWPVVRSGANLWVDLATVLVCADRVTYWWWQGGFFCPVIHGVPKVLGRTHIDDKIMYVVVQCFKTNNAIWIAFSFAVSLFLPMLPPIMTSLFFTFLRFSPVLLTPIDWIPSDWSGRGKGWVETNVVLGCRAGLYIMPTSIKPAGFATIRQPIHHFIEPVTGQHYYNPGHRSFGCLWVEGVCT